MASALRLLLLRHCNEVLAQRARLPWLSAYLSEDGIHEALVGATHVLRELGVEDAQFDSIPAEELAPAWTKQIGAYLDVSWRAAPDIAELQRSTMRELAVSVYALLQQRVRHRQFLAVGAPAGVSEFPAVASHEKTKTLPLPLLCAGNPATVLDKRYQAYLSHVSARRRKPGARSSWCALPPDTARPALYS
jgi:hypothetical protein